MRLNLDCIRAILLCVEEYSAPNKNPIQFVNTELAEKISEMLGDNPKLSPYQQKLMEEYSNNEIIYSLNYCIEAGLLHSLTPPSHGIHVYHISDLTVKGHDFLGSIRYQTVFEKIKNIVKELGAQSVPAVMQISSLVTSELIKSHFVP